MTLFVNKNDEDAHQRHFVLVMLMLEVLTEYIHGSCALSTQLSESRVMVWLNSYPSMSAMLRILMWRLCCLIVIIRGKSLGNIAGMGKCCHYFVYTLTNELLKTLISLIFIEINNCQDNEFCDFIFSLPNFEQLTNHYVWLEGYI